MSDSLHLSGPEANMDRESFLEEAKRAEKNDGSEILKLLAKVFVNPPEKTIDEMTDEETLQHKYWMEECVRKFRVHLLVTERSVNKRKEKLGKKVFEGLDANFKPKPIPETRKANDKQGKLIAKMMEELDITEEEAKEMLRKR